jgi:cytochrome c2
MDRLTPFRRGIGVTVLVGLLLVQAVVAQHSKSDCDVGALLAHQNEHAQELESIHDEAEADLDAALATLYRTGIAYQALALECGFVDGEAVEATHEAEHASDESGEHSENEAATQLEIALSVGDPEAGEMLFTTFRDEVSFACATCHRVDSTERLIGPGLLGVGNPTHDPSSHADEVDTAATEEAAEHEEHHQEATAEATAAVERTIEETIAYLHTSIIDPNAYVVPDFPADLMPATYADIFTEEEINNLVAYLLTL